MIATDNIQLIDGKKYQSNLSLHRVNDAVAGSVAADGKRVSVDQAAFGDWQNKIAPQSTNWIRSNEYHGRIGKGESTHGRYDVVHNPVFNAPAVDRGEYGKGLFDNKGNIDEHLPYFERIEGENRKQELNMNRNNFNVDQFETRDGSLPFVWNGKDENAKPFQ